MPNTLGLDDDLDSVVLLREIERSFGVTFSDSEALECLTVGDAFEILERHFLAEASEGGCATSMAFYRLRRALLDLGAQGRLRPETGLANVTGLAPRRLMDELESRSGLRLPVVMASSWLLGLFFLLFAGLLASALVGNGWLALGLLVFALATWRFLIPRDGGTLPNGCETLGGLARKAATLNYAQLVGQGAGVRDGDLWRVFCDLLAEHTVLPKEEIGRETFLLQKQMKTA
ncbi:hypothetical protein [Parvibaculum sp.]|uniref:hypothetical protein n=1 Tax=Parvibaculum sp. TaxID=2024848 RepID=UPI0034A03D94